VIALRDRDRLEAYLRRDPIRHVYSIGDLDPVFWPHTTWWAAERQGELVAVVLLYTGLKVPTCLALTDDVPAMRELFHELTPILPDEVYLHLEPGLRDIAEARWKLSDHGLHLRMSLTNSSRVPEACEVPIRTLGPADADEVLKFYDAAFPEHWFDPRTLGSGLYVGIERAGALVAVAGVHVWSAELGVAALGNIATSPKHRGQGLAYQTTAAICRPLIERGWAIGLNVAASNAAAVHIYEKLGFTVHCELEEWATGAPPGPKL
jgi:ribosomal protein S18 acetylase RimI-like enzyme